MSHHDPIIRLRVRLRGTVQGVGFRPFVYRLAASLAIRGWVNNSVAGVAVEAEGALSTLQEFRLRLEREKPPGSFIESFESSWLDPVGYDGFEIRASDSSGEKLAAIAPDLATCPACRSEVLDPANRRFAYPFTNCTHCGPRYSIIEALPYDRPNTTMRKFRMCARCQAEYENPLDRRFHAQPNACPECGPHLALWDGGGRVLEAGDEQALRGTLELLRQGRVLAVKGLGGFHLIADAQDEPVVRLLRERKRREEKPFALMFPSVQAAREHCDISAPEERLLRSPECPIVLLRRRTANAGALALSIAPGNPYLGVMLPYTPLHHLLLARFGAPVIATSGNLSDEPICIDEQEAVRRLNGIADAFLVHDRPIARHVDDSVVRLMLGRELVLRRSRGYAPLPIPLGPAGGMDSGPATILAVGAHLKNAIALAKGGQVFVSQHIGDLETSEAHEAFIRVASDLPRLYDVQPALIAADLHPDYSSTRYARQMAEHSGAGGVFVQHHVAHVLSCMAENELRGPVLGVAWDGTGYGTDGTIWGGEFLVVAENCWRRVAHWRQFRLPGGERAIKEPRRAALGVLFELFANAAGGRKDLEVISQVNERELAAMMKMMEQGLNSPWTSSVGRLFDAVAAILGLRQTVRHEGQAAMELEFCMGAVVEGKVEAYPVRLAKGGEGPAVLDWGPMIEGILESLGEGVAVPVIARRFHETLATGIVEVAREAGCERVVLSGGCFQNQVLTGRAVAWLREGGFQPYWHQRVPPNDGGIALGQVAAARWGIVPAADQGSQRTR